MVILLYILLGILVGVAAGYYLAKTNLTNQQIQARQTGEHIVKEARKEAESLKKKSCLKLKKNISCAAIVWKTNIAIDASIFQDKKQDYFKRRKLRSKK